MSILTFGLGPSGTGTGGYSNMFTVSLKGNNPISNVSSSNVIGVYNTEVVRATTTVKVNGIVKQVISNEISN